MEGVTYFLMVRTIYEKKKHENGLQQTSGVNIVKSFDTMLCEPYYTLDVNKLSRHPI